MRLGAHKCYLKEGSKAREVYGDEWITERHRHRYEFNGAYRDQVEEAGLHIAGVYKVPDTDGVELVEMIEVKDHPFFVATQAHPEFKSRPVEPHPLFKGLVGAAVKRR